MQPLCFRAAGRSVELFFWGICSLQYVTPESETQTLLDVFSEAGKAKPFEDRFNRARAVVCGAGFEIQNLNSAAKDEFQSCPRGHPWPHNAGVPYHRRGPPGLVGPWDSMWGRRLVRRSPTDATDMLR